SSAVVGGRDARARLFIEQNLSDPDLGPHTIARSLKVSARYLRMIFAREGECISSYVLRRRLEETARQLADPRWRGRSICEIAFQWGFNSAPHFSRSFRSHFGMSPREYRALHAGTHARQPDPLAGTRWPPRELLPHRLCALRQGQARRATSRRRSRRAL